MLDEPLTSLPRIGKKQAEKFGNIGINRVRDLLYHLPTKYEDRTRLVLAREACQTDGNILVGGTIRSVVNKSTRSGPLLECSFTEQDGNLIKAGFWHLYPNQIRTFEVGKYIVCYGKVEFDMYGCHMKHPDQWIGRSRSDIELPKSLSPIYPATNGLKSEKIAELVSLALEIAKKEGLEELLPASATNGITLLGALAFMHNVPSGYDILRMVNGTCPERNRIALEEMTANTAAVYAARAKNSSFSTYPMVSRGHLRQRLLAGLGFSPTGAQLRVTSEIDHDMAGSVPMMRLLQGDVGSGKTLVAAMSALNATENGYQTAIMAPTEILASQHYQKFTALLSPMGICTVLINGRLKAKDRKEALEKIASGVAQIVIGTHALFQEQVAFSRLGYVIIDEQHRFGVEQRLKLLSKGQNGNCIPHQLIMTATPIPRTLAMTSYADLSVSSIDELPPGRKPITTKLIGNKIRYKLINRIRDVCVNKKWQIYWVCPLIEESEVLDCAAAEHEFERLKQELPELKIGLVHGKMSGEDKQSAMSEFKSGSLDMLVATTVIEVGVDVPNANIIVIEDPQRLGLAQLHQLRGRVGRGQQQAFCMLYSTSELNPTARERLEFLCGTTNGLEIAQKDLEIRGPGEYLGTRQTGVAGMKIADFLKDQALIPQANHLARVITDSDPAAAQKLVKRWTRTESAFTQA